jgi:hypothetical protein
MNTKEITYRIFPAYQQGQHQNQQAQRFAAAVFWSLR